MSYSEDYRRRVIEYRNEGHTLKETGEVFDIGASTICRWNKRLKRERFMNSFAYLLIWGKLYLKLFLLDILYHF